MATRKEIIAFCDELLEVGGFDDYGPNGLQVPGAREVTRIASGVSAHLELIERASEADAQLLLAHHGLFWDSQPRSVSEQMAVRLWAAFDAGLSIAAYHLPLDAHREVGNNALLCEGLGFEPTEVELGVVKGRAIGVVGERAEPLEAASLVSAVAELVGREPLVFDTGPERISTIGIVSGAGSSEIGAAVELGLDAFLTGEPAEHAMADAREGGLHYVAAGHYATETLGIRRLGELVAAQFGIEHVFCEIPNPV